MTYVMDHHERKNINIPEDLPEKPTKTQELIYHEKIREAVKQEMKMDQDLEKLYSVVWGQCTPGLKAKLMALKEYKDIMKKLDSIQLLELIKKICYNFQENVYAPASVHSVIEKFINCKQGEDMNNQVYLVRINDAVNSLKSAKIEMLVTDIIIEQVYEDISNKSNVEKGCIKKEAKERFFAFSYLKGMD